MTGAVRGLVLSLLCALGRVGVTGSWSDTSPASVISSHIGKTSKAMAPVAVEERLRCCSVGICDTAGSERERLWTCARVVTGGTGMALLDAEEAEGGTAPA